MLVHIFNHHYDIRLLKRTVIVKYEHQEKRKAIPVFDCQRETITTRESILNDIDFANLSTSLIDVKPHQCETNTVPRLGMGPYEPRMPLFKEKDVMMNQVMLEGLNTLYVSGCRWPVHRPCSN